MTGLPATGIGMGEPWGSVSTHLAIRKGLHEDDL